MINDYIVYKTTDLTNGKIYIGYDSYNRENYYGSGLIISNIINKRIKQHVLNNESIILETVYKEYKDKYSYLFFTKEILEHYNTKEEMLNGEIKWIKYFNSNDKSIGYNLTKGGEGGDTFTNNPNKEEIRKKVSIGVSIAKTGKKLSPEHCKKISIMHTGKTAWNKDKKGAFSQDAILKMSNFQKGKIPWNKGKKDIYSQETLKKMKDSRKGKGVKKVYSYDIKTGYYVSEYESIKLASNINNLKNHDIRICCKENIITKKSKFIWSYEKLDYVNLLNYEYFIDKKIKMIYKYSKSLELLNIYDSITIASNIHNIKHSSLSYNCLHNNLHNNVRAVQGFIWSTIKYTENDIKYKTYKGKLIVT